MKRDDKYKGVVVMTVTPTYPGVYLEEIPSGVRTIVGVSTSIAAFVGSAKKGPIDKAVHIFNYGDYERCFGGLSKYSEMSYAVRQFFLNGGNDAWVVRVAKNADAAKKTLKNNGDVDVLKITALNMGETGKEIEVQVDYKTDNPNTFNLFIGNEKYSDLSMDNADSHYVVDIVNSKSQLVNVDLVYELNGNEEAEIFSIIRPAEIPRKGTLTSGTLVETDLENLLDNGNSFLISIDGYGPDIITIDEESVGGDDFQKKLEKIAISIQDETRAIKQSNPAYINFTCKITDSKNGLILSSGSSGPDSTVVVNEIADDELANRLKLLSDATSVQPLYEMLEVDGRGEDEITESDAYNMYIASRAERNGIYALEDVDIFNILCLPGISDSGTLMDASSYCQERRAFMIIDAPSDKNKPAEMIETIKGTALPKSDYAAVYYPWIQISDPLKSGKLRSCPPSGTIAGLYARTDSTRGVWKAPAGMDATLSGVQGVDYLLTDMENGTLNPLGVNCIRIFPVFGTVAWGSRTLRGSDQMTSEYKYIPIRRLALFIEESLYRGTQWVVFEPNDEPLWSQIRLNIGTFMHSLFRQGAFQGKAPKEAYFVKCDKETTTQDDINKGIVNIVVGFAPLKPAEFVIIQIQQMAGQIQA